VEAGPLVECSDVSKSFGAVRAVDGVSLTATRGEILALLGPSGCGKTTTLRLIAGFERPDAGTIRLDGHEVAGPDRFVPPERRTVGVVFQDYALFPHLTVADNIGYGVRSRGRRRTRIGEMLDLVGLSDAAGRLPHELSGGQQQRVAIARALAPGPELVLLDEPFSNLDATLRVQVRAEVRAILAQAEATAVFVTHDQEEALSLADRVAVMRAGRLLQVDEPTALYARPNDRFVATFVGDADLLPGYGDGRREVATVIGTLRTGEDVPQGAVQVALRPERVHLRLDGGGHGVVTAITYFGHDQLVDVELGDGARVRARMGPARSFEPGDRVSVAVSGDVIAFPASGSPLGGSPTGGRGAGNGARNGDSPA
jgi:iron(III) transport system ATP-binding protein